MSVNQTISGEHMAISNSSPALVLTNAEEQERLLDTSYEKLSEGQNDLTSSEHSVPSGVDMNGDSLGNDRSKSGSHRSSGSSNLQTKKRNKSWYHALTANYKTKHQDFRRIFYGTPVSDNERLLVDFACALLKQQSGLLLQGRIYITENWICFFSKIIAYETKLTLDVRSIASLTKERTARVFPNAIQIVMERGDKYFFTSFGSRDRTFQILNRVVQTVQNGQSLPVGFLMPPGTIPENLSQEEFWEHVHDAYGEDLGLDSAEEADLEYICPNAYRPAEHHLTEASSHDPPPNIDLEEHLTEEYEEEEKEDLYEEDEDDDDDDDGTTVSTPPAAGDSHLTNGISKSNFSQDEPRVGTPVSTSTPDKAEKEVEEVEEDVECRGHDHFDNCVLDAVYPMSIEAVFNCLFTDSAFFRRVHASQRTFAVTQATWPDDPDENGEKERIIYYTLRLSNALGPKTSPTVEKQVMLRPAYPEDEHKAVTVDAKVRNGGVPYCDSFHVVNRYCLTRRSSRRTGLKVTSQVVYDKSIFFPSKTLIESTAKKGLSDFFQMINKFLLEEASGHKSNERIAPLGTGGGSTKRQSSHKFKRKDANRGDGDQRRGRPGSEDDEHTIGPLAALIANPERSWHYVIAFGLVLCLVFAVLYSKFLDVERITAGLYAPPDVDAVAKTEESKLLLSQFASGQDWASLLRQQDKLHRNELKRWRAVVDGTVTLMEEMQASLLRLRETLDNLEKMAPPLSGDDVTADNRK